MGVTLDDLSGDGAPDVLWPECGTLAVSIAGAATPARFDLGDNAAVAVYTMRDPSTPDGRVILWLGMDHIAVYRWTEGVLERVPGDLGLSHDGFDMVSHINLFDANGDGVDELLLGRTSLEGPFRKGVRGSGMLASPTLWTWSGDRYVTLNDFDEAPYGIWHTNAVPDAPGELLMLVDDDVSMVGVEGELCTPLVGVEGGNPMGGAFVWTHENLSWDFVASGLGHLHHLRNFSGEWFDASHASGLQVAGRPDVTWAVLPVDGDGDGREEIVVHAGTAPLFDDRFGVDKLAAGADVHVAVSPGTVYTPVATLDPTPALHTMGAVLGDLDGDLRPDLLQRTVRRVEGDAFHTDALSIVTHLARTSARWAELRFGDACEPVGAMLSLDMPHGEEKRFFQPYSQTGGFGNAPLDRTWVAVPEGDATHVVVQFPDGGLWEGDAPAGHVTRIDCR